MSAVPPHDDVELPDVVDAVRRAVGARVADPHVAEEIVQESLVQVAVAQRRLQPEVLQAYAIRTAQNLVVTHSRRTRRERGRLHRLVEPHEPHLPDEALVRHEESAALARALQELEPHERELLMLHEVDDVDLGTIAELHGTSRGAVAMKLSRVRAALRLEFVLAYRKLELPTDRCRNVLLALATADVRRQAALDAPEHLDSCATCCEVAPVLVERRRAMAPFAVGAAALVLWRLAGRALRRRDVQIAGATLAVAAAAALTVAATRPGDPTPPGQQAAPTASSVTAADEADPAHPADPRATPAAADQTPAQPVGPTAPAPDAAATAAPEAAPTAAPGSLTVDGTPIEAIAASDAAALAGRPVIATAVLVDEVPADEGIWVLAGSERVWVRLAGSGESPAQLVAGQVVTFSGTWRAPDDGAGTASGELAPAGGYVDVPFEQMAVAP